MSLLRAKHLLEPGSSIRDFEQKFGTIAGAYLEDSDELSPKPAAAAGAEAASAADKSSSAAGLKVDETLHLLPSLQHSQTGLNGHGFAALPDTGPLISPNAALAHIDIDDFISLTTAPAADATGSQDEPTLT